MLTSVTGPKDDLIRCQYTLTIFTTPTSPNNIDNPQQHDKSQQCQRPQTMLINPNYTVDLNYLFSCLLSPLSGSSLSLLYLVLFINCFFPICLPFPFFSFL